MTYRTTTEADRELIEIYVFGAERFGVQQSEQYLEGLFQTFDLLAENPYLARERRELNPPMRLHPYGAHMIVYTITGDDILIVRVLHGRQDWQTLFS
ncbi:type II toxin-antitoxin system RelE/ParE family toxin [Gellertiella hungarica]|uniref:Toxin n=1 Tax=Gellertiella hungarica TaxID=1572859 RepID=A0A7W6NKB1_9HYPH|nr:type II toxin-antitoxin system RelE/ParE family toxin [Gellertiella hungarica]MBB4064374.1 toxin ParE1/3/4 [Gellertiella hungarica]